MFPSDPNLPTSSRESDHSSDHTGMKEIIPVVYEANKTKKRSMATQGKFLILKAKNKGGFQCFGQCWYNLVRWGFIDIYPQTQEKRKLGIKK